MSKNNKNFKNPVFWIITTFLIGITVGLIIYFTTKTGNVGSHFTSRNSELGDGEQAWQYCHTGYIGGGSKGVFGLGTMVKHYDHPISYVVIDRVCDPNNIEDIDAKVQNIPWGAPWVDACNRLGNAGKAKKLWTDFHCEWKPLGVWLKSHHVTPKITCQNSSDCPNGTSHYDGKDNPYHNFCNMNWPFGGQCETCDNFKEVQDCYDKPPAQRKPGQSRLTKSGAEQCVSKCFPATPGPGPRVRD